MGLDMCLNKHYYNGLDFSKTGKATKKVGRPRKKTINGLPLKEEVCEGIYWRKANAIHGWFVRQVQGGEDDCRDHEVSTEQLEELLKLVTKVLKTKNASLLPPTPGFFFGSTEVDEDYWTDLKYTKKELTSLLKQHKEEKDGRLRWFTYNSSW